jgi:hypothetical protein
LYTTLEPPEELLIPQTFPEVRADTGIVTKLSEILLLATAAFTVPQELLHVAMLVPVRFTTLKVCPVRL